eukprot:6996956-Lingulodinium_polyedra.AAC.1
MLTCPKHAEKGKSAATTRVTLLKFWLQRVRTPKIKTISPSSPPGTPTGYWGRWGPEMRDVAALLPRCCRVVA